MLAQVVLDELSDLDQAVYGAIAHTRTPQLDRVMARLSDAANYSRLSLAAAAALAVTRGDKGRQAAALGLASVGGYRHRGQPGDQATWTSPPP